MTASPTTPPCEPNRDQPIFLASLLAAARGKQSALLDLARTLVLAESPSSDKAAVDACGELAVAHAKALGGRVKRHRQGQHGDVLELRFGPEPGRYGAVPGANAQPKPLLVLGHLDTVWPLGTLETMPCHLVQNDQGEGRLHGPGALDMKVGVAMALTAVELLAEATAGGLEGLAREIVLLLNPDEEIGSPVSRPITEALALESAAVYVVEPAQGPALKTARKGTGNFRIEVTGVGAHAGVDFTQGRSAIVELARQIERISRFTDLKRGLTVSVGRIGGGTVTNAVPAHAWAEVDIRIARQADGARIEKRFAGLKPSATPPGPDCRLTVTGGINRPPMERGRGTAMLFEQARRMAAELGWALEEAATGGASDGNFTAALGIPTLDGMGAVGAGAHAPHEHVALEHLAPRTALLAAMLAVHSNKITIPMP